MSRARPTTRIRVGPDAASHRCTLSVSGQSAIHRYVPLTTTPTCGVPLNFTAAATGRIRVSTSRGAAAGSSACASEAPSFSDSVGPDTAAVDALYSLHPASNATAPPTLMSVVAAVFTTVVTAHRPASRMAFKQGDEQGLEESTSVLVIGLMPIASQRDT